MAHRDFKDLRQRMSPERRRRNESAARRMFQGPPADNYAALVAMLPPRPIRDKHSYEAAVEMMGRLVGHDLNRDQQDYLEALGVFVKQYEAVVVR